MPSQKTLGLLNLNKSAGLTSRQVVNRVARLVKPAKAGHAGTLDPLATGVLVVCIGSATRLISYIQDQPKVYRGRFLLGRRSDTDDVTGNVTQVAGYSEVTRDQIQSLLPRFQGQIEQIPPQYSAVRVGGRRAYKLARKGQNFKLSPKTVEIHRLELVSFQYPQFELEVECGSGTYIRSLGRDIGNEIGCGAVMSELTRTRIGPFSLENAVSADELTPDYLEKHLLPLYWGVVHLPQYVCTSEEIHNLRFGRWIRPKAQASFYDGQKIALITDNEELAAVGSYHRRDRTLAPKQVFLNPEAP